jgi:hypothetical protein
MEVVCGDHARVIVRGGHPWELLDAGVEACKAVASTLRAACCDVANGKNIGVQVLTWSVD